MAKTYHLSPSASLFHADCRDALRMLPDNCVDSVVTDPPYHLTSIVKRFGKAGSAPAQFGRDGAFARASAGFMGKEWDGGDIAFQPELWAEVLRVLKPGGHIVAFGASRGYHRMACAIEDAGFEIRDSLMWVYGTGFPKSHDISKAIDKAAGAERTEVIGKSKRHGGGVVGAGTSYEMPDNKGADILAPATPEAAQWQGWGTALKPAFEPIVLARKPLSEPTVAANVLRWGTGALNIDGCRVPTDETITATRNIALGSASGAIYGKATTPGIYQQHTNGRWPANVCHDGSDEVIEAFPDVKARGNKGDSISNRNANVYGKYAAVDCGDSYNHEPAGTVGSAARFFYSAKASRHDRAGSKHPTVKPISLKQWLARLITPPGGVVLDPFAGSGTTGAACALEGFACVMIEREDEYVQDIVRRLA